MTLWQLMNSETWAPVFSIVIFIALWLGTASIAVRVCERRDQRRRNEWRWSAWREQV